MKSSRTIIDLRFLGTMVATVLAAFSFILLIPDDRYLRYQQLTGTIHARCRWIYERLHFDPTPVDVAIIGASRILYAVNAPRLEADLAQRGINVHVANLAVVQAGFDLSAVLEHEAINAKHPKLIIVMAVEKFPHATHPAFRELADVRDAIASPMIINENYLGNLLRVGYRQLSLAIVATNPRYFGYDRDFDPGQYAGTEVDTTKDNNIFPSRETIEASAEKYRKGQRFSPFGSLLQRYEFAISFKAYEDMARYAAEDHAKMFILYQGYFKGPGKPLENDFLESLAPVVPAHWGNDDYHLFYDGVHHNVEGAKVVTDNLADVIAQQYSVQLISK